MVSRQDSANNPADPLVAELADNFTDGASTMARHAIRLIERYANEIASGDERLDRDALYAFVDRLASARPSMHAIARVLHEWRNRLDALDDTRQSDIDRAVQTTLQQIEQATRATVERAVEVMKDCRAILTHSASSTVQRTLETLDPSRVELIATESEPGGEGRRLARSMEEKGYRCRLVADSAAVDTIAAVDAFVVGADAVLKNGDFINKVGTRELAEAALDKGIPTIVVAESFKRTLEEVPIEAAPGSTKPLFELIPNGLVTWRISDDLFASV
jgi:translation initiation factor 2B subunit (eIF-2B alpha/beta/delta family)